MTAQPDPTSPEIQLLDLEKHFREIRAVDGVSLEVHAGEFFSLLGPSGCGKTTTLRMIGGFELPTAGRILLRGRDATMDPPDKRPVNMVFQNYALFPHLDVGDNIAFGLRRRGVDRQETRRRVGEALELVQAGGADAAMADMVTARQAVATLGVAAQQSIAGVAGAQLRPHRSDGISESFIGAVDEAVARKQQQTGIDRILAIGADESFAIWAEAVAQHILTQGTGLARPALAITLKAMPPLQPQGRL